MNISIALCDNSSKIYLDIISLINEQIPNANVRTFRSAEAMLKTEDIFDIYLLDIKGINGIEVAKELRKKQNNMEHSRSIIIFITGYREYMEEAFDVQAFHYLIKPLNKIKFSQVLKCACKELKAMEIQHENYILLKFENQQQKVPLKDIIYIESNNKKVSIHTMSNLYEVRGKMEDFELTLGELFYRCHRCYLVNFSKITAYNQNEIKVINGDKLLIAQRKYPAFVKAYLRYAKGGGIVNV